jgi:hypothetical protein
MIKTNFGTLNLPLEAEDVLNGAKSYRIFDTTEELALASTNGKDNYSFEVQYEVKDKGMVTEAIVHRVTNGISANFVEEYMRRRDPDTLVVADNKPSDKPRFKEKFGYEFNSLRKETIEWLKAQDLGVFFFRAGLHKLGVDGIAILPVNAAFFAMGLSMLQQIISSKDLPKNFEIKTVVYVAPPFRHTHFNGKQIVVHNRKDTVYEVFAYNLYPGPSAKKGLYGVLLSLGEQEGWVTAHCSAVQSISPYDNITTFMHEGASGGGKSEMLQHIVREREGEVKIGQNIISGEKRLIQIPKFCEINPICDDMGMCHPSIQKANKKLRIIDGENAWFIRTDNVKEYGTEPLLEKLTINTKEPLLFLNIQTHPGGTALIWNHIEDKPGKACPNPRVIVPRAAFPNVVSEPASINVRSFGVRTPPCSAEQPSYGIIGVFHMLPPALAWLWRLVSPRGYANPSITSSDKMESEGVGSYWPFATGKQVTHANLLLEQFVNDTETHYTLTPNQHIGVWKVGFTPQLLMREYFTRRGNAKFRKDQYQPARCSLLGFEMNYLTLEGSKIPSRFLKVYRQPEVGEAGYDAGAKVLTDFFHQEIKSFLVPELSPLGREIIETCLRNGSVEDYLKLMPVD